MLAGSIRVVWQVQAGGGTGNGESVLDSRQAVSGLEVEAAAARMDRNVDSVDQTLTEPC